MVFIAFVLLKTSKRDAGAINCCMIPEDWADLIRTCVYDTGRVTAAAEFPRNRWRESKTDTRIVRCHINSSLSPWYLVLYIYPAVQYRILNVLVLYYTWYAACRAAVYVSLFPITPGRLYKLWSDTSLFCTAVWWICAYDVPVDTKYAWYYYTYTYRYLPYDTSRSRLYLLVVFCFHVSHAQTVRVCVT